MRLVTSAVLVAAALTAGCKSGGTHCSQFGGVAVGMTGESAIASAGQPDVVTQSYGCRFAPHFVWFAPGAATVEWAWTKSDPIVVAWLHRGVITDMGTVPVSATH